MNGIGKLSVPPLDILQFDTIFKVANLKHSLYNNTTLLFPK